MASEEARKAVAEKIRENARKLAIKHVPPAETPYESMAVSQARGWVRAAVREASEPLQERVDVLEKALREVTTAVAFPEDCKHDSEPLYCDSCRVEWEKELSQAMTNASAALSPKEPATEVKP